jgi:hypothetical protein
MTWTSLPENATYSLGKIQERHGIAHEEAEKELKAWEDSLKELRRVHHYSRSHGPS